jgi:(+)-pinoresinol hydroxylase
MRPSIHAIAAGLALSGFAQAATPSASPIPAPAKTAGEVVYDHWCAPCHAPGPGHPGTESLQLKYSGQRPATLLDRSDLSAQAVATYVRQGVLLMAPFRKTEISDPELQQLAAYVAGNFGKAP